MFVFEPAHRIVVEWCVYGNAAYVFEIEEPLPVDVQVRCCPGDGCPDDGCHCMRVV